MRTLRQQMTQAGASVPDVRLLHDLIDSGELSAADGLALIDEARDFEGSVAALLIAKGKVSKRHASTSYADVYAVSPRQAARLIARRRIG
jgi:hypothetical protein